MILPKCSALAEIHDYAALAPLTLSVLGAGKFTLPPSQLSLPPLQFAIKPLQFARVTRPTRCPAAVHIPVSVTDTHAATWALGSRVHLLAPRENSHINEIANVEAHVAQRLVLVRRLGKERGRRKEEGRGCGGCGSEGVRVTVRARVRE